MPNNINEQLLIEGFTLVVRALGLENTPGMEATPVRAATVYKELFIPEPTQWPVFDEDHTDMVILRGFEFYTFCPHHLLPVKLTANVGYLPNGKVIGASKLGRMCLEANTMPKTQEALTTDIINCIDDLTSYTARGSAIVLTGEHGCFRIRGLRSCSDMVTDRFTGAFDAPEMRERFYRLIKL